MRKYISILIGITLIAISIFIAVILINNSGNKKPKMAKATKTVFVNVVKNKTIPIRINSTGSLVAKNRIEIYSEVQGVLNIRKKDFKAGTFYAKDEIILSINTDEHLANLRSLMFNVSNVRNPGSIKLRDTLLISKLFSLTQNPAFYSVGFAA